VGSGASSSSPDLGPINVTIMPPVVVVGQEQGAGGGGAGGGADSAADGAASAVSPGLGAARNSGSGLMSPCAAKTAVMMGVLAAVVFVVMLQW
jgi:hypothetical protein